MLARGFPALWCDWMDLILKSSRSAVLLNGVPGKWFQTRCGLRQGDPISPYVFLIVADVLQRLIRRDDLMRHPLVEGAPPLVLQYADDTLIIMRACPSAAARLHALIDDFAAATGLIINYSKSTLVPMGVDADTLAAVVAVMVCWVEGFPQTYLGLPLCCHKLALADFHFIIDKVDRYLAGWRARLLSPAGRLVLINAVLDALPSYAMGALKLPPKVTRVLDSLRRAFLWNAVERASGAQCLVAWDQVCRAKEEGGLGVRDLATQNISLLLKVLHRLHSMPLSRWASWVWSSLGERLLLDARGSSLAGEHWVCLRGLVPLYRSLSRVDVGDGRTIAFWEDHWLPCGPIRTAFPALASHATCREVSVWAICTLGLDAALVPRLSVVAARERLVLLPLVEHGWGGAVGGDDRRRLVLCEKEDKLASGAAYRLLRLGGGGRREQRIPLELADAVSGEGAGCPACPAPLETPDHLFFGYPFAREFWGALGLAASGAEVLALHCFNAVDAVGSVSLHAFVQLCCWHLWKRRNAVVFRQETHSLAAMLKACRDDAVLWRCRFRSEERGHVDAWVQALHL
ncbi:uncharacterized protein [Aegilops tauschii subsp. strangulata]|uniref:uncharacterized protein n=1 Tax=Aegilops tauschii subsp. strangulata TaxID=200361 RepID=UPI003CC8CB14